MSEIPAPPQTVISQFTEVMNGRRRTFTLSDSHIQVVMKAGGGMAGDVRLPLKWVSPDYSTHSIRAMALNWLGGGLALAVMPLVVGFYFDVFHSTGWKFLIFGLSALGLGTVLAVLARAAIPRRMFAFMNHQGIIILTVIQTGPESHRAELFVDEVRDQALKRQVNEPPAVI